MKVRRWLRALLTTVAPLTVAASAAHAQAGVTVTGRVTSEAGAPIPGASVFVQGLNVGTLTGENGQYTFTIAANRATGQAATLTARVIGFTAKSAPVTLTAGTNVTQDFVLGANPLRLNEIVVTGAGTSTTRERLATSISTVDSSALTRAAIPQNIVSALSGKAPGVEVRTQSGDPGASASIKIRGSSSLTGTGQPLFVVDGQPIDNSTAATSPDENTASQAGTVSPNRAADINPNDIESIDILKGSAAASIYGARASNGVVLITTKRGRSGPTRYSFNSTETFDRVQPNLDLQRTYGQGSLGAAPAAGCGVTQANCGNSSWGPLLAAGTPTYDHQSEIFTTGLTADNNLQVSGGSDRTTFFISGGLTSQNGATVGPNDKYNRASVRLKGTQQVASSLLLGANLNYVDTRGRYVQKGSNTSGLLLGALRAPPDFNNLPYLSPTTGLQRSYQFPNPAFGTDTIGRGYDNPFWTANVPVARSELGRSISNVNADWNPLPWLTARYTLGADYYEDWRLESLPFSSSDHETGRVIRNDLNNLEIDHNLTVEMRATLSEYANNTVTLGQNLNSRRSRSTYILGEHLNAPEPFDIDNTLQFTPTESRGLAHIRAYFVQDELDLFDQLYVNVGVRDDGFSTFGSAKRTALYPKASLAWTFTNAMGNTSQKGLLSYGKLRLAYGETGKEPPLYASISSLSAAQTFSSGFGDFLNTNQSGHGGLTQFFIIGNPDLKPERSRETEYGGDFGFFDQRADLSLTGYSKRSSGVILPLTINAAGTGYVQAYKNAASITNKGVEASMNIRPYTSSTMDWDVGIRFTRNRGKVLSLAGTEAISLNNNGEGFGGAAGSATVGYQPGVIRGQDFVRCGYGLNADVGSGLQNVDSLCGLTPGGYKKGALFIGPSGLPVTDPADRVIADPNPKHLLSYNASVRIHGKLSLSTLFDASHGGQIWNGTRGQLDRIGTHSNTLVRNQTDGTFGKNFLTNVYPVVAGPGAGTVAFATYADWQTWFQGDGGANGPQEQFVEDASFVKWRELSLTYTIDHPALRRWSGFGTADVRIAGRNLKTWTKYTGFDPEANLQGAETLTQGIDYFNNPQTRSFVVSISLNR